MRPGFSLIEAMLAVAIMGVIASIAVPNMMPVLHRSELGGATDNMLGFVARARVQSFADRRCVQVVPLTKAAGQRQKIVMRELNTFDCDGTTAHTQSIASAPRLAAGLPLWSVIDTITIESPNVSVAFVNHPATLVNAEGNDFGTLPTPGSVSTAELRFRGNGRVWSPDPAFNDDVTFEISHTRLADRKRFRLGSNGTVLDRPGGT
jgi:prepilin-type N-terminal cleavage/methylation domain-containing protein